MKRTLCGIALLLLAWLATGFYVVRGNERGVVRRCGRLVATESGRPLLRESGWHYDLPWPFSRVDRVNLNAVRTLTIGMAEPADVDPDAFLPAPGTSQEVSFLTGDKNVLHLQIAVQYRISEERVADWLFAARRPDLVLERLTESISCDLIAQSGVDFVHPLGLGELREQLTQRVREESAAQRLGVDVDEVSISAVYPPLRVKSYFVDVSNARADRQKYINAALAYAQQREASSRAAERRILDAAATRKNDLLQQAQAQAESFRNLIAQLESHGSRDSEQYAAVRRMTLQRRYLDTLTELLARVKDKIVIGTPRPADITIFGTQSETAP
jgi:membrane protease subunit HflK